MLDRVVHHLRSHGAAFRISSHPSPEPLPAVVYRAAPGALVLETLVVLAGGRPAIACLARGDKVSLQRLKQELGTEVASGSSADLPAPFKDADGPLPPLGSALGALTIIDESVTAAASIAFAAFSPNDVVEIPYDDFSRLEQPRIASFAIGGELPEYSLEVEAERRSA